MGKIVIKKMESEAEINGKGYVHYKSWHETYTGLIDADYLERQTLEKCIATAHKRSLPSMSSRKSRTKAGCELMKAAVEKLSTYKKIAVWVLKGNERAIRFYERFDFRFDGTEAQIMLGTPNTELRMVFERDC